MPRTTSEQDLLTTSHRMSHSVSFSQNSENSGDNGNESSKKNRKKVVFLILAISNIMNNMCLALIAPIFPQVATSKGVDLATQGWIFGVFALTQCLTSPLFGKLIPHVGAKFTFVWGTIFTSGCCVLFGFLPWIEDSTTFVTFCFLVRIFLAIGTVSTSTSVFVIAVKVWPDQVAYILGTLESLIGIGFMIGPALSGFLFDVDGFYLPFVVVGVVILLLGIISAFSLTTETDQRHGITEASVSIFSLLKIKPVLLMSLLCIAIASTWISLDPVLQPHLEEQFDMSATAVGFVFLIPALLYAVSAPLVGKLVDKLKDPVPLMIGGYFAVGTCFLFFGPSPLFGLRDYQKLWLNFTSLAAMGLAFGFAVVPVYERLITFTKQAGYPDNTATMSAIGSIFWSAYAAGDFLGPVMAGLLVDNFGFQWCMTAIGLFAIVPGFLLTIFWVTQGVQNRAENSPVRLDEEKMPLLDTSFQNKRKI